MCTLNDFEKKWPQKKHKGRSVCSLCFSLQTIYIFYTHIRAYIYIYAYTYTYTHTHTLTHTHLHKHPIEDLSMKSQLPPYPPQHSAYFTKNDPPPPPYTHIFQVNYIVTSLQKHFAFVPMVIGNDIFYVRKKSTDQRWVFNKSIYLRIIMNKLVLQTYIRISNLILNLMWFIFVWWHTKMTILKGENWRVYLCTIDNCSINLWLESLIIIKINQF